MPDSLDIFVCLVLPVLTAVGGAAAIGMVAVEISDAIETGVPVDPVTLIICAAVAVFCLGYTVYMCRELAD